MKKSAATGGGRSIAVQKDICLNRRFFSSTNLFEAIQSQPVQKQIGYLQSEENKT